MNTLTVLHNRECLSCGKPVKGRSDKKFCNDNCRNNYNNRLKNEESPYVQNINVILRKNRRILASVANSGEQTVKTTRTRMLEKGFSFRYITQVYTNKKGAVYYFCYEYGYLFLENDRLVVVKRREGEW